MSGQYVTIQLKADFTGLTEGLRKAALAVCEFRAAWLRSMPRHFTVRTDQAGNHRLIWRVGKTWKWSALDTSGQVLASGTASKHRIAQRQSGRALKEISA